MQILDLFRCIYINLDLRDKNCYFWDYKIFVGARRAVPVKKSFVENKHEGKARLAPTKNKIF